MLRCEYEFEAALNTGQIFDDILGLVDLEVIENQPDCVSFGILGVKYLQKFDLNP